jgi:hypothetical protein
MARVLIANLPSPPGLDVYRDMAGAYGTALNVRRRDYGHSSNVFFPTFVPYLATALRKAGHEVQAIDGQVLRSTLPGFIDKVVKKAPDIIIAMPSLPSLVGDCHLLRLLKLSLPKASIIAIGPVANALPYDVLNSGADLVVKGSYPFYHGPIIWFLEMLERFSIECAKDIPGAIYIDSDGRMVRTPDDVGWDCDCLDEIGRAHV